MSHWHGPSKRVANIPPSAIHAMTALSKTVEDVAFLSWAKPTSTAPKHIHEGAATAIADGRADGYSETKGLQQLREEIVKKLGHDNRIEANPDQIIGVLSVSLRDPGAGCAVACEASQGGHLRRPVHEPKDTTGAYAANRAGQPTHRKLA